MLVKDHIYSIQLLAQQSLSNQPGKMSKSKESTDKKYSGKKRKDDRRINGMEPEPGNGGGDRAKSRVKPSTSSNSVIIIDNIPSSECDLNAADQSMICGNDGGNDHEASGLSDDSIEASILINSDTTASKDILLLELSWGKIVTVFTLLFEKVFTVSSKLYLDVASNKIDGATVKWCPIILLDTLISLAIENSTESKYDEVLKRKFNQYSALHSAVCVVVSEAYVKNSFKFMKSGSNYNMETFPVNIDILVPDEWATIGNYKNHTCSQVMVSKSMKKMNEIVDFLFSHRVIKEKGIVDVLKVVVSNIYNEHFRVSNPDNVAADEPDSRTIDLYELYVKSRSSIESP